MKGLTQKTKNTVTVDNSIQLDNSFADIIDYLISQLQKESYKACQIDFKNYRNDNNGYTVTVTTNNCKDQITSFLQRYIDAKSVSYDSTNGLIKYLKTAPKKENEQSNSQKPDPNAMNREKFKNLAYGGEHVDKFVDTASDVASNLNSSPLTEEINRLKKLMSV